MKKDDGWFTSVYNGLSSVIAGMARKYAATWGLDVEDLVQAAGLALWECGVRYADLPLEQQLRIGNTIARRTMLHWCEQEGRNPTHLGTAGSIPWFTVDAAETLPRVPEEEP